MFLGAHYQPTTSTLVSLSVLKRSFYCLLVSIISFKKSAVIFIVFPKHQVFAVGFLCMFGSLVLFSYTYDVLLIFGSQQFYLYLHVVSFLFILLGVCWVSSICNLILFTIWRKLFSISSITAWPHLHVFPHYNTITVKVLLHGQRQFWKMPLIRFLVFLFSFILVLWSR